MARLLFGTDGIRSKAGEFPLDRDTVHAIGAALGGWVRESKGEPEVVIGMDTRESGPWISEEIAGGLARHSVHAQFAGVTTTPGVAYLAKTGPFSAGVMISASHNPFEDNGIKILAHTGYKLADEQEEALEQSIFSYIKSGAKSAPVTLSVDHDLDNTYIDHLAETVDCRLEGLRVIADCANGSASELAPQLLARLGANVETVCAVPNGRNINKGCGSLHLEELKRHVLDSDADVGVAFDGDADRALFVAKSGKLIDGDAVLLIMARQFHAKGELNGSDGKPIVVATVMSNLGLERALSASGIALLRTPVGDKYVLEEMLRSGAALGGEQSGHIIFTGYATTGDGMLTALRVFELMCASQQGLDDLTADLKVFPQLLVNVRVKHRKPLAELPSVNEQIRAAEASFGDAGRVLVRFSGTEPLARVMVEGPDLERVETFANRIAASIRSELGGD